MAPDGVLLCNASTADLSYCIYTPSTGTWSYGQATGTIYQAAYTILRGWTGSWSGSAAGATTTAPTTTTTTVATRGPVAVAAPAAPSRPAARRHAKRRARHIGHRRSRRSRARRFAGG